MDNLKRSRKSNPTMGLIRPIPPARNGSGGMAWAGSLGHQIAWHIGTGRTATVVTIDLQNPLGHSFRRKVGQDCASPCIAHCERLNRIEEKVLDRVRQCLCVSRFIEY